MNIREFTRPASAKKLNESLAKKFGAKIDIDQFTTEQLQDARNKLRTSLSQVETNEAFDSVQDKTYQKSKLLLDDFSYLTRTYCTTTFTHCEAQTRVNSYVSDQCNSN